MVQTLKRGDLERARILIEQAQGKQAPPAPSGYVAAAEKAIATETAYAKVQTPTICSKCGRIRDSLENMVCKDCAHCPVCSGGNPDEDNVCEPCVRKHGEQILCISCRRLPLKGRSQCAKCFADFYQPGPKGPNEFQVNEAPLNVDYSPRAVLVTPGAGASWSQSYGPPPGV